LIIHSKHKTGFSSFFFLNLIFLFLIKSKNRLHLEALKDNSGGQFSPNSDPYSGYGYLPNSDYKSYENFKQSPLQENSNKNSPKILIIIFGVIIGIFSITALAISIYILIRLSTSTTALG